MGGTISSGGHHNVLGDYVPCRTGDITMCIEGITRCVGVSQGVYGVPQGV